MGRSSHILPQLGKKPIREIDAASLLVVLRRVEENGTKETAHRLLRICGQILRYAVSTSRADKVIPPATFAARWRPYRSSIGPR